MALTSHVLFPLKEVALAVKCFLPAGCVCASREDGWSFAFPRLYQCLYIHTYHVCNNYITYIVAIQPYFSQLQQISWLLCVATMSSLA